MRPGDSDLLESGARGVSERSQPIEGAVETPDVEVAAVPDLVVSEAESQQHSARWSRLALVPGIVVLIVAATTWLLVVYGPAPQPVVESDVLSPSALPAAIKEPTDKLILRSWWLLAIIGALVAARIVRSASSKSGALRQNLHAVLNVMAVAVIIASLTWGSMLPVRPLANWAAVGTLGLVVGLSAALLIYRMWTWPDWAAFSSSVVLLGLTLAYAVPALWQTSHSIRDWGHFTYTADELAAIAAGHLPLSDYIPQYSALLGFPVAPALRAFPDDSIAIIVLWLIFLQVVALGIAVAFPVLLAGRRMLAPAFLLGVLPPLATGEAYYVSPGTLFSASTYFASFPMRVVMPSVCLLVAFLVLRNRSDLVSRSHIWKLAILGSLTGATMLNNPDFGVPAAVVVLVTMVLAGRTRREYFLPALITLMFALGAVALYAGGASLVGRDVSLENWLLFVRTFGIEGYYNAAMESFGLHIAVVSLFISAAIFGYVLLRRGRHSQSFMFQQGLALALVGGWSLLALPYFIGRSFASTLIVGYAFQIGLVVAAFLPLIWKTLGTLLRSLPERVPWETALGMVMGTLAIASAAAFLVAVRIPSDYARFNLPSDPQQDSLGIAVRKSDLQTLFADPSNSAALALVNAGRVQQALDNSGLTALSTGMRSALVASHPEYLALSPAFISLQCRQDWPRGVDHILVSRETAAAFAAAPECQNYVDSENAINVIHGSTGLILLPAAKTS